MFPLDVENLNDELSVVLDFGELFVKRSPNTSKI